MRHMSHLRHMRHYETKLKKYRYTRYRTLCQEFCQSSKSMGCLTTQGCCSSCRSYFAHDASVGLGSGQCQYNSSFVHRSHQGMGMVREVRRARTMSDTVSRPCCEGGLFERASDEFTKNPRCPDYSMGSFGSQRFIRASSIDMGRYGMIWNDSVMPAVN
jgi:hypothetical protein